MLRTRMFRTGIVTALVAAWIVERSLAGRPMMQVSDPLGPWFGQMAPFFLAVTALLAAILVAVWTAIFRLVLAWERARAAAVTLVIVMAIVDLLLVPGELLATQQLLVAWFAFCAAGASHLLDRLGGRLTRGGAAA